MYQFFIRHFALDGEALKLKDGSFDESAVTIEGHTEMLTFPNRDSLPAGFKPALAFGNFPAVL
jgi:hypothetical protein